MKERPIIDLPDFPHGTEAGYNRGCGCDPCRLGRNKAVRERNARRAAAKSAEPITNPPIPHRRGPVEKNVRRELKGNSDYQPPWHETLNELAIQISIQLDKALEFGPATLVSPLTAKLVLVLDRIRSQSPAVGGTPSEADDVEAFVNGLSSI
jgi:hypothetical protein